MKAKHKEVSTKIGVARKSIGERLWNLKTKNNSKSALTEAVKNCKNRKKIINGSKSVKAAVDAILELRELLAEAKKLKMERRNKLCCGFHLDESWPKYPLHQRLKLSIMKKERVIEKQLKKIYRLDKVDVDFYFRKKPCTQNTALCFSDIHHVLWIRLNKKWRNEIFKNGHHFIDGLFNLEFKKKGDVDDIEVYKAAWLQQWFGYYVVTIEGFIAKCGEVYYHGKTFNSAVRGVKRKVAIEQQEELKKQKRRKAARKAARLAKRMENMS